MILAPGFDRVLNITLFAVHVCDALIGHINHWDSTLVTAIFVTSSYLFPISNVQDWCDRLNAVNRQIASNSISLLSDSFLVRTTFLFTHWLITLRTSSMNFVLFLSSMCGRNKRINMMDERSDPQIHYILNCTYHNGIALSNVDFLIPGSRCIHPRYINYGTTVLSVYSHIA